MRMKHIKNVKEKLYELIGGDYYISFVDLSSCSICAVKDDISDDEYKEAVAKSIAYANLNIEDKRVSKNVYRYYGKIKELKII